ncbi:magnesium transporter [Amphibacillus sp. MSJ-3]|uniref:magnesium transporter n=1 Tax=Amphibacillus sp. MSJ-3 TaxID=2841505 RepID=UPI001C0F0F15|nr:magnesium transporter [Amphibacillus sp. MSJ-3]MBU5595127.1 magnesium transporter [Amphibacillus sp. MSJ-3]
MERLNKQKREQYTNTILDTLHKEDMKKFRQSFLALHPSDQLDIFISLSQEIRIKVYGYLSPSEFAEIFSGLDIKEQKLFFLELDEKYSSMMFNHMFTDDVVNFLAEINPERAETILLKMDIDKADQVRSLRLYAEETAGSIMTKELIWISSTEKVANVLEKLRLEAPNAEIIYYLYVIDSARKLVGVVSLRDLIVASPEEMIENIMSTNVVSVTEDMDQEDVGKTIKKYDFLAVPVVSRQNRLLGIVTVDDIMDILEEETTEDFEDLSATKGTTDLELSGYDTAKKRAPWIIALMFLGLLTAGVIGYFEETLETVVLLSVFIPMIMDSAGNVGTQSLTVAVRGLALGNIKREGFWRMIKRELSAGFILGLICMVAVTILISIIYGNWILAVIVGISILCTLTVSTVVGFIVPLIINKLKFDPAIASGPFITTLNDILGLVIYFSIATALMDLL